MAKYVIRIVGIGQVLIPAIQWFGPAHYEETMDDLNDAYVWIRRQDAEFVATKYNRAIDDCAYEVVEIDDEPLPLPG